MKWFDIGAEANGFFAIGQLATGVVAIGQFATGVIAIGQLARGVIALGQVAVGIFGAGQIGGGVAYGSGMLGVGMFAGGLLPIPLIGHVPFTDLIHGRFRIVGPPIAPGPVRLIFFVLVMAGILWLALLPLWDALFGVGGVLHQPA